MYNVLRKFYSTKDTFNFYSAALVGLVKEKKYIEIAKICKRADGTSILNSCDAYGNNPFCVAVSYDDMNLVKFFLQNGVNINQKYEKYEDGTILHYVALRNHVQMANILLENGCNPNILNKYGLTPLNAIEKHLERHAREHICDDSLLYADKFSNMIELLRQKPE